jgi:hypothetical protein
MRQLLLFEVATWSPPSGTRGSIGVLPTRAPIPSPQPCTRSTPHSSAQLALVSVPAVVVAVPVEGDAILDVERAQHAAGELDQAADAVRRRVPAGVAQHEPRRAGVDRGAAQRVERPRLAVPSPRRAFAVQISGDTCTSVDQLARQPGTPRPSSGGSMTVWAALITACVLAGCVDRGLDAAGLGDPATCEGCHPDQVRERASSMLAYASDDRSSHERAPVAGRAERVRRTIAQRWTRLPTSSVSKPRDGARVPTPTSS